MNNVTPPKHPGALPELGSEAPDAITLGRLVERKYGVTNKMLYGGALHTLVIGANGKGKGTRILMPNLLQMSGSSIVVVDPKGELAAVTAPYRRTLGEVVILNPFGVLTDIPGYEDLKSVGHNPLAHLDPTSPSFNAEAGLLAEARTPVGGKDPHWDESARAMDAAFIMHEVEQAWEYGQTPSLTRVRKMLCEYSSAPSESNGFKGTGIPARALEMMKSKNAGLRNKASQFADWNREIQSIASTAKRHTECFDDPEISEDLSKDGFDFRELKKCPVTVYLILPPEMMARHSKWLRLMITSAMQAVMRPRKEGEPKVLFMIDEFFALGHLDIIEKCWAVVRGYGVQIMPVIQDLNQLKKLYPELWETFIAMAGAVLCFGPNDLTTAKWLSERIGDTTRIAKNKSISTTSGSSGGTSSGSSPGGNNSGSNSGWSQSTNTSESENPVKVPLIAHHQLFGLKPGYMIVTIEGLANVITSYAPAYYEIKRCEKRARDNPYFLKSKADK